jgi:protein-disulfide isomerase
MKNYNLNTKFLCFIKIFLIYFVLCVKLYSDNIDIKDDLIVLGENNAPVKVQVFSSFTCPHCANFHFTIVPKIEKEFIDSGKVQLIFVDFPLDQAALNASKLLHCIDKNKQIDFMDAIYKNQTQWTQASNINEINNNLKKIYKDLGISLEKFDHCLINVDIEDKILNGRIEATKKYSIKSTPTIVINEKKLEDSVNFKNIKKKIEKLI